MYKQWTQKEEAQNLRLRFEDLKASKKMGQAEFARVNEVPGGPSLLSQHIKNRRPINLEAAMAYARGFECSIAEISPRIAKEIDDASGVGGGATVPRLTWTPKEEPEHLQLITDKLGGIAPIPGYSPEALALAWLLDQVKNRLDKKKAETEASAVILRYVNLIGAPPTRKPDGH